MTEATRLMEWIRPDGTRRAIIHVVDTEKDAADVDQKRLELCTYDSRQERWATDEKLEFIDSITGFSIPEDFLD